MPLRLETGVTPPLLFFEGIVTIEETDQLLETLKEYPGIAVDLSACEHLHTAPLQTLKMLKVPVTALPEGSFWKFCFDTCPSQAERSLSLTLDPTEETDAP